MGQKNEVAIVADVISLVTDGKSAGLRRPFDLVMRNCLSLKSARGEFSRGMGQSKLAAPTGISEDDRADVLHVRISKKLRGVVNKLPTLGVSRHDNVSPWAFCPALLNHLGPV